jgi:2,4-dienoyl-CoA reductase-like NADH-dependent reductase (Old Yellow Enzyme family)
MAELKMFAPGKIGNLVIRNRFVRSATAEGLCEEDGQVTDKLIQLHQKLAENEVGLITTGFAYVMENGRATHRQIGIYRDELVQGLRKLVKGVKEYSETKIFVQLAHAGREVLKDVAKDLDMDVMAPSAIMDRVAQVLPREMTQADIEKLVKSFVSGARRGYEAEFDGIQLHCAHGYMLNQFLSPFFNQRSDDYGGSLENRFRIVQKIIQQIHDEIGKEIPITVKLNTQDFVKDSPQLTIDESKILAKWMVEKEGVAAIETSGGTYESMLMGNYSPSRLKIKSKEEEAYFLSEAKIIKKQLGATPVILVGGLRSKEVVESVLKIVDFVAFARPFVYEPDLITKWKGNLSSISGCISCNRCLMDQESNGLHCVYLEKKERKESRKEEKKTEKIERKIEKRERKAEEKEKKQSI